MKKRWLILLVIILCMQILHAQYYFNPTKIITGAKPYLVDYSQNPVKYKLVDSLSIVTGFPVDTIQHPEHIYYPWHLSTLAEAFDTAGNLVFWSNGTTVSTLHSAYMKGGDTLSNSAFQNSARLYGGIPTIKGAIVLPCPGKSYLYFLIYPDVAVGDNCPEQSYCLLFSSTIDMRADSGRGEVVSKENLILDAPYASSGINAVRHSNGRDWWIVQPDYGQQYDTGGYYVALLDTAGIHPFEHQRAIGAPKGSDGAGNRVYTAFSTDGEWLVCGGVFKEGYSYDSDHSAQYVGFELLRFDRCTGKLSDCHTIIPLWKHPALWNTPDLVFSASGHFLYVTNGTDLYQFDMYASDIAGSATYISARSTWGFGAALMPDSSIFLCTNESYATIIKHPDEYGTGCDVQITDTLAGVANQYERIWVTTNVPHYPNYMLGAKECKVDTPIEHGSTIVLGANPVQEKITLYLPDTAAYSVQLYDAVGRKLIDRIIAGSYTQQIDVPALPTAVYELAVLRMGKIEKVFKVVKAP